MGGQGLGAALGGWAEGRVGAWCCSGRRGGQGLGAALGGWADARTGARCLLVCWRCLNNPAMTGRIGRPQVGPLSQVPYMKRVAVAHQLHHSEKYGGVPWGLFLGPQEVAAIPGAGEELDRLVEGLDWSKR
eukprot:39261-Chlamydomonas_euryale.AAC.3